MRYKTYKEYKNSKLTWLGNIPDSWEIERLGYHSTIITGHPFNSDLFSIEGKPLIRIRDLKEESTSLFWNHDYPDYAIIHNGDLLVGMDGDFDVVSWKGNEALLNQRIFKINAKNKLSDNYLKYILQIPITHINELTMSTTVKHLSVKDVNDIKIPLPSTNEQNHIANYLDKKTAKLDETITKNNQLIELLEEKRIALINQVVTKGLNPDVPMKDSGIDWIEEIPENWDVHKIKNLIFFQEGPGLRNWQFTDEGIRVICVTNITEKGIDFSKYEKFISEEEYHQMYHHFTVNKGDLLLSSSGNSWGKVAEYTSDETVILNTSTIRINKNSSSDYVLKQPYIKWVLQSEYIREQLGLMMTGSCQPNFGPTHLAKVLIALPTPNEQDKIAKFLNNKILKINKAIYKIQDNIELLEEYKTSLIHHAVTGKIDVRGEEI